MRSVDATPLLGPPRALAAALALLLLAPLACRGPATPGSTPAERVSAPPPACPAGGPVRSRSGGCCAAGAETTAAGELSPAGRQALLDALDDERRSRATYAAAIARFGERPPFANTVHAEACHANQLAAHLRRHGLEVPADPWDPAAIELPASFGAACAAAVEAELRNVALYDRLLPTVVEPDVRATMERLRAISLERHLPAFRRWAVDAETGA